MQPDVQTLCHLRQSPSALRQSGNSTETRQQVIAAGELRTGQDGGGSSHRPGTASGGGGSSHQPGRATEWGCRSCALAAMGRSIKQLGSFKCRIAPRRRSHLLLTKLGRSGSHHQLSPDQSGVGATTQSGRATGWGVGAAPSQRWGGRSSNWGHSDAASRRGGAPTNSSQNWAGVGATTNSHQIRQVWELPLNQAERLNGGVGAAPSQRWGGRSSSNGCSAVAGKKAAARS